MADDANFCRGRLRLAAFLRVVGKDMPPRPSRFKRRRMPLHPPAPGLKGEANSIDAANSSGRSSRTRKRQLPANGLALLRTTTADSLPEPGDAHKNYTVPITETDPVDDSQLDVPINQRQTKMKLSRNGHMPQECRSCPTKQPRNTLPVPAVLAIPSESRLQPCERFYPMADGFAGNELALTPVKNPGQRGNRPPRKSKPTFTVAGLDLASGVLPAPAVQYLTPSTATES